MKTKTYQVTDEAIEFEYGEKINKIIIKMYHAVDRFPFWQIKKLKRLIKKYPEVPQFMNYLMIAYTKTRQDSEGNKIIKLVSEKHPNYFFGKVSLANYYIEIGEYEKIPDVLGSLLDVSEIYPERNVFHISEVANFNLIVAKYYLKTEGYYSENFHTHYYNINRLYKNVKGNSENEHTKYLDILVNKVKETRDKER